MINNKQVNLWRGSDTPPTIYHIWLKDESLLLRYDEPQGKWIVFLDSAGISKVISDFMETISTLVGFTINGKPLNTNPVLNALDLLTNFNGNFIKSNDTILQALYTLDKLLTTKVYDGL